VLENSEKRLHFNSSVESFESALSPSEIPLPDNSFDSLEVETGEMSFDQNQVATQKDIVSIIRIEIYEVNGEAMSSPMLNAYDALVCFRFL